MYRWLISPPQADLAAQLAARLGVSPLLAQCLLNRGLADAQLANGFLEPRLRDLADPFLLPDMAVAVDRLMLARERQESVVIFGDYDVDGVTATALIMETLRPLGWTIECYLPHRFDEGYGLSPEAVDNCLRQRQAGLLLALDCGSTSNAAIASLRDRGIDTIVVDHHQVSSPAPPAVALVNPQTCRSDVSATAPAFYELCSVGLSFKLAHALVKRGRQAGLPGAAEFDLRQLLDLVALGTVADLVPLTGENRILVAAGLRRLNATDRAGLLALKARAQCPECIQTYEVGFQLAPRLNAAGRMENASRALQLLLTREPAEAQSLAECLDGQNRERQQVERAIAEEALALVRARFETQAGHAIVEARDAWHLGVVGIVASRVLQQFYRPTIILGGDRDDLRGSGRSIPGFDLAEALRECGDLLLRHGGHAMAAGVTLRADRLEAFRERLDRLARERLAPEALHRPLALDAEVRLQDIDLGQLAALDRLKPMGQGNPAVQVCARRLRHHRAPQRMGAEKQHARFWVTDGSATHEAVWWNPGSRPLPEGDFDLAFLPQVNCYNGSSRVQLKVLDWRPTA